MACPSDTLKGVHGYPLKNMLLIEVEGTDVDRDVLDDFVDILYFEDVQLTETNVLGLVQCCKQFGVQGELLGQFQGQADTLTKKLY
jgi:hypothetical protein